MPPLLRLMFNFGGDMRFMLVKLNFSRTYFIALLEFVTGLHTNNPENSKNRRS